MAKLPDLYVNAVTTFDGKALAKGQKQIGGFEKGVKNLAKTFGVTFGAAAMLSYGKNAVKAFAENEKSAKRLETVLKNLGLAFDTDIIEKKLGEISASYGYQGEVLREAFQKLITVTGDTTKAQDLLNLSLDVAAGSGQDLLTVNQDLAALYVGNTKGLRKYNLGLTQTELKTLDFNDAVKLLTRTFAGAGKAELETFSGQMRILGEAADNAQEIIGTGLVTAFGILAGDQGIGKATVAMEDFADSISDVLVGLAEITSFEAPSGTKSLLGLLLTPFQRSLEAGPLGAIGRIGAATKIKPRPFTTPMTVSGSTDAQVRTDKARAKAAAEAAKREKERLALLKKSALAEKNKLSLSKAAAVFDSTQISIAAALRATYDKETILRLEALQAIEREQGDLALKKINELAALQKNADLAKLAGITTIGDAALQELNNRLLKELQVINDSKMAEGDKELAREEAFKKYNAALVAAGGLAEKNSYDERTQIQLTEIARLAALSTTANATLTLNKIRESEEINMIDRVAKAQKAADDARLKALQDYIALLGKVGTTSSAIGTSSTPGKPSGPPATFASVKSKEAADAIKYFADTVTDTFQTVEDSTAFNALVNSYAGGKINPFNAGEFRLNEGSGFSTLTSTGAYDKNYYVTVNAGVVGSEEVIVNAVQDAILTINRRGDSLTVAGTL
jgi:hypothetical protein